MKFLIAISLLLNVGLGFYAAKSVSQKPTKISFTEKTPEAAEKSIEPVETNSIKTTPEVVSLEEGFNWAQVESEDYKIYVANLRAIGCPERTIRDIIEAELEDWFLKERKQLLDPIQRNFWELAKNGMEKAFKNHEDKIDKLEEQRDKVLAEVLGAPKEEKPDPKEQFKNYADFLPAEKLVELSAISDKFNQLRKQLSKQNPKPSSDELRQQMKELSNQQKEETKSALTPEEYAEYQLRSSRYVQSGRVAGFEATEDELRAIARIHLKSDENSENTVPATDAAEKKRQAEEKERLRDEEMKLALGADRFMEFKRGKDEGFSQIYRIANRFGLPKEVATQADDIRKASTAQAAQVRKNAALSAEQRAEVLQTIKLETHKALEQTMGATPLKTYQKNGGDWINDLGKIAENKP